MPERKERIPVAKPRRRIVPLKRTLRRGDIGPDVFALKRALEKARCINRPKKGFTRQYGPNTFNGVRKFQRLKKMKVVDGVYGIETHRKLMPFFDNYGAWLMGRSQGEGPGLTVRQKVVNEAQWGYNNRNEIHYEQVRPMRSLNRGHKLPQTMDCSEFATVCYRRAEAPDPNARGYDGYGYTGTLSQHGRLVSLSQARPGDLVFYGSAWPFSHVAVYAGFGKVFSHGSEGGPYLLAVDYRRDRRAIRSYLR
jgi:hypothetical protein